MTAMTIDNSDDGTMTTSAKDDGARRLFLVLGILGLLLLSFLPSTLALPVPATGLTPGASSRRNLTTSDNMNVSAVAGNVTQIDILGISITTSWQGFYGNISGNIILADASNNSFYEWGNGTSITGEVFASRATDIVWNTINCSNSTQIAQEEAYLNQSAGASDSVSNTFNETDHTPFLVGLRNMHDCPSTNVFTSGSKVNGNWDQILLADTANKTVYTTIIDRGTQGFDGRMWDFQLLVGENGKNGDTATMTYYFFTELG